MRSPCRACTCPAGFSSWPCSLASSLRASSLRASSLRASSLRASSPWPSSLRPSSPRPSSPRPSSLRASSPWPSSPWPSSPWPSSPWPSSSWPSSRGLLRRGLLRRGLLRRGLLRCGLLRCGLLPVAFFATLVVGFFLLLGMVRLLGDRCITHPSSPEAARHGSQVARANGELVYPLARARVAELADAPDLGSGGREAVGVRVSPLAPLAPAEMPFQSAGTGSTSCVLAHGSLTPEQLRTLGPIPEL